MRPPVMTTVLPYVLLAAVGLMIWGMSLGLPLASLHLPVGRSVSVDLPSSLARLLNSHQFALSIAVGLTLLLVPALRLATILLLPLSALRGAVPRAFKRSFLMATRSQRWGMVDVFLLGSMIALLRLEDWGHIELGLGLFGFAAVALSSLVLDASLHPGAFLGHFEVNERNTETRSQKNDGRPIACHGCDAVWALPENSSCPRCETTLSHRKARSMERSLALLLAAALLVVPANLWPVLSMNHMGERGPKTIYGGVVDLAESDNIGLAVVVFVASLVVPLLKIAVLAVLLFFTHRRSAYALRVRTKALRLISLIGRWSMVDIFAALILFSLARFGWFGSVYPGRGAIAFCAVVFLTMLATESFDSRLMWDRAGKNPRGTTS